MKDRRCPPVYVLVLNWNCWADTVECLESVFRSDYPNYRVIVCDNGSADGSLEHIAAWAEGRGDVAVTPAHPRPALVSPPVPKPVPFRCFDRAAAEAGGSGSAVQTPLVLIDNGQNLGYAGGNNVGLRYALARDDFSYVWLLNPDTVVAPEALSRMVSEMEAAAAAGLCGSTVLFYDEPDRVQALGGAAYYKWFAIPRFIGQFQVASAPIEADRARARLCHDLRRLDAGLQELPSRRRPDERGLFPLLRGARLGHPGRSPAIVSPMRRAASCTTDRGDAPAWASASVREACSPSTTWPGAGSRSRASTIRRPG